MFNTYAPRGVPRFARLVIAPTTYVLSWGTQEFTEPHMSIQDPSDASGQTRYGCVLPQFLETYVDGPTPGSYLKGQNVTARRVSVEETIDTLEGPATVPVGSWVVRDLAGNLWQNTDDVFHATYVLVA